jgi:hypothetical protein
MTIRGAFNGGKATWTYKMTTHLYLVLRLRLYGVIPKFPTYLDSILLNTTQNNFAFTFNICISYLSLIQKFNKTLNLNDVKWCYLHSVLHSILHFLHSFPLTSVSNEGKENVLAVHTVMLQTCVQKITHDDELTAGSLSSLSAMSGIRLRSPQF